MANGQTLALLPCYCGNLTILCELVYFLRVCLLFGSSCEGNKHLLKSRFLLNKQDNYCHTQ